MRFLQNLLITNNAWVYWKVYFWAGSLVTNQNELQPSKSFDVNSENVFYFNIWVSYLCFFNPSPLLSKWMMALVGTTYRNMESRQSCRTTYMMRIKESERRPFFKFLDGILFCTIHTRQMKLWQKSRNGDKKFQASVSKALAEFY